MVKVVQASVKYTAGREFESKIPNGRPRQNVVFRGDNGEDYTAWFNAGEYKYCSLSKGDRTTLLVDGNKISLVDPEQPEAEPEGEAAAPATRQAPATPTAPPAQQPDNLQQTIIRHARIIASCHAQVTAQFTNDRGELLISEETVQKYVCSLFITMKNLI